LAIVCMYALLLWKLLLRTQKPLSRRFGSKALRTEAQEKDERRFILLRLYLLDPNSREDGGNNMLVHQSLSAGVRVV